MTSSRSLVFLALARAEDRHRFEVLLGGLGVVVRHAPADLRTIAASDPDALVADEERLDPSGLAAIRAHRDEVRLPVAVLVDGGPDREAAWLEAGANEVLRRPIAGPVPLARLGALLRRRRRVREMLRDALRDPLTGLANRALLEERLHAEFSASRRHGRPLSVALLDLDGFKAINDRRGHLAGDALLAETARRLRRAIRAEDVVGRYGGDEFLVLLPRTPGDTAMHAVRRLVRAVSGVDPEVACSAGVAGLHQADATPRAMLERADRALYAAKARGGGGVLLAPSP